MKKWEDDEIIILEDCYKNHIPIEEIQLKLDRSKNSICEKARKLQFDKKYPNPEKWTEEEIEILTECYNNHEPREAINARLPNRTRQSIHAKVVSLGLTDKKPAPIKWTSEELDILMDIYKNTEDRKDIPGKIKKYLPNHTYVSVKCKVSKMGLSKERKIEDKNNLIGKRFGRWTIIGHVEDDPLMVYCRCDCGTERKVCLSNLKKGISKSCGCYRDEISIINGMKNKKANRYDLTSENYGIGWTNNGDIFYFDKEDFDLISKYCWHRHQDGYMRTRYDWYADDEGKIHNKYIMLHQLIAQEYYDGKMVDHINGLTYDNRKANLRAVSQAENMKNQKKNKANKSGHKGVIKTKEGHWLAYLTSDKKRYNLGTYKDYNLAIKAREEAEKMYFKEYNRDREYL